MNCPYCNNPNVYAVFVDVDAGIGFVQVTPYLCDDCGASQFHSYTEYYPELLSDIEREYGWYKPMLPTKPTNQQQMR